MALLYTLLLLFCSSCCFGQVSLALSSATVQPGSATTLNLTATSGGTASAIEWTLVTTADVTSVQTAAGPSASAAGKTLSCNNKICLLAGTNMNVIPDGVIATVRLTLSPSATEGSEAVQLTNITASSPKGDMMSIASATAGTLNVTVQPVLSDLSCLASTLYTGESTVCTVSMTDPPPPGTVVAISTGSGLTAPTSVSFLLGAASAQFVMTSVDSRGKDSVSATFKGTTVTFDVKTLP